MEPSMTHPAASCIKLLLNLPNKLDIKREQRRWSHQFTFAHKLVLHLPSQRALVRMAKPLSFHNCIEKSFITSYWDRRHCHRHLCRCLVSVSDEPWSGQFWSISYKKFWESILSLFL